MKNSLNHLNKFEHWQVKINQENFLTIKTLECHTGGEPLRIITSGFPTLQGSSILAKRRNCQENHDHLRRALMFEPRGHADMYGAIITEPERETSHFGAIFIHNEGYSTMCGHAVIALAKCAVESGVVEQTGDETKVVIDVPCGQIHAKAFALDKAKPNIITQVSFDSVPSFVFATNQVIEVEGIGTVHFDIAFGGAFYAYVQAASLPLTLTPAHQDKIIAYGRKIKEAISNSNVINHPFEHDLSFLYGVIFIDEASTPSIHSRNVCIFADGELDRSPTGSGVSGRIALHLAKGELPLHQAITIESILGSQFKVKAIAKLNYGTHKQNHDAIVAQVTGEAFICGKAQWLLNKDDPLQHGFLLR